MNRSQTRYSQYALTREMMDTAGLVADFDPGRTQAVAKKIQSRGRLHLTGEGSSRILPAKNAMQKAMTWGVDLAITTDGSRQSSQYDLSKSAVFCASNSGKTKEIVLLAQQLAGQGNPHCYGLTANRGTPLEQACAETFVLDCGWEQAVAATKSVVEQALFYESIVRHVASRPISPRSSLAPQVEQALGLAIDPEIVAKAVQAPTIYFSGYNNGVAEELTLKTNEITRKKSDFLEGTYAVHGIEEVMDPRDIVFVVDPIAEEITKFQEVLVKGVGLTVVALADRDTPFKTIRVPAAGDLTPYVYLCAGWNLLVEIGLALGINLDKPERARKIGNELGG